MRKPASLRLTPLCVEEEKQRNAREQRARVARRAAVASREAAQARRDAIRKHRDEYLSNLASVTAKVNSRKPAAQIDRSGKKWRGLPPADGASLAAAAADATRMAAEVAAHADAAAAAAEEAAAAALEAAQMAVEVAEIAAEARTAAVAAGEIDVASGLCDDAAAEAEASDEMRVVDLGGVAGEMSGEQVASPSALFSAARRRMRAIWPRARGGQSPSTLSSSRPNSNEALGVVPVERQRSRELSSRGSSRTSWMASALAVSLNAISPSRRSQRHRPRDALSSSADGSADRPLPLHTSSSCHACLRRAESGPGGGAAGGVSAAPAGALSRSESASRFLPHRRPRELLPLSRTQLSSMERRPPIRLAGTIHHDAVDGVRA